MLYELFSAARRSGLAAVEADIEEPDKSKIFTAYPAIMKDRHVLHFICDTMRMASLGTVDPFDLDQMMELDMDVHHHESSQPVAALTTMADSLPGLGIVAAVLGVVITMGALGGPPEEIGHKVAAALVGTFLGILLCYGLVGPMASNMAKLADDEKQPTTTCCGCCMMLVHQGQCRRWWRWRWRGARSLACAADASRAVEADAARRHRGSRAAACRRPSPMATATGSSSSRRKAATAAITAAPGRWPTPISSPP